MAKKAKNQEKAKEKEQKKCVVGYKRVVKESGDIGYIFDKLIPCCPNFQRWFERTGNFKLNSVNQPSLRETNGFNLVLRSDCFVLVNRLELSLGSLVETEVKFCQSCGKSVEMRCTQMIELKPRTRVIHDGYDEIVRWQEGK